MTKPKQTNFNTLRAKYVERIKTELPYQVEQFRNDKSKEKLTTLSQYLHKIAGSGGSFGFDEITHLGKAAESIAAELKTKFNGTGELNTSYFESLLGKLLDAVNDLEVTNSYGDAPASPSPAQRQRLDLVPTSKGEHTESKAVRVWIVDDDESVATQLSEQLSSFGFEVRYFLGCASLKNALDEHQPDFVIADVKLENDSDFYQCIDKNRIDLQLFELIMMSAFDDLFARIKAVRAGALTYVQKPINVTQLASTIREHQVTNEATPERILLIDDDIDLSKLYQSYLEGADMQVHRVTDPKKVICNIQKHQPDLVLIDLYMPDFNGMELASVIRQYDNFASLPIVYVSSETNSERQRLALSKGADDFLTKPLSKEVLINAVRQRVKRARKIDALISKDSLTSLLKHSAIKDAANQELARVSRTNQTLCLCMLDIDRFKRVNDTFGHAVGDTVIASLATLLTQRVRQTDHVGRYGGEEFMLVLPGCDASAAASILEDIRQRFAHIDFTAGSETFRCTVSAGYVEFKPSGSLPSVNALVECADRALYEAKNTGRNRVVQADARVLS